jgi:hypothetical protein
MVESVQELQLAVLIEDTVAVVELLKLDKLETKVVVELSAEKVAMEYYLQSLEPQDIMAEVAVATAQESSRAIL